jgi:nitrogen regulatory protein P-II 2
MTDVMGFGHQKEPAEIYRGTENAVSFIPKVKIDVMVSARLVDKVIDAIMKSAGTGQIGDGKIFVADIEHVMRIRTGESDIAAL